MSPGIRVLTLVMLALPLLFLAIAAHGSRPALAPALFIFVMYVWVWTRFRPSRFILHPGHLEVVWPLKRREIRRETISDVRIIGSQDLKNELGFCMRVGAGGLWGGFGWLWTQKRGIVQMYITRTDRFVWIERRNERSWLITPERPEEFMQALNN
jgi:hypothetical protein